MSFQLLFLADRNCPSRLSHNRLALPERGFVHAAGRLALWRSSAVANRAEVFEMPFSQTLGVCEDMQQKLIEGTSTMQTDQTHQNRQSRARVRHAAEAHALRDRMAAASAAGDFWSPRQHTVLSEAGSKDKRAFVDFLRTGMPRRDRAAWLCVASLETTHGKP
ncbi:hypothetical protein [Bradyrhizobium sp. 14AA]